MSRKNKGRQNKVVLPTSSVNEVSTTQEKEEEEMQIITTGPNNEDLLFTLPPYMVGIVFVIVGVVTTVVIGTAGLLNLMGDKYTPQWLLVTGLVGVAGAIFSYLTKE